MRKLDILECGRGFAAVYVFLYHLKPLEGTPFDYFFRFGQEAVILFFLVSGFVIYHSFSSRTDSALRSFIAARVLRIYPVYLLSLAIAFAVSFVVKREACGTSDLLGNLVMLQDRADMQPGSVVAPFCGNGPLWSLSYEWWFYCMFAVLFLILPSSSWGRKRVFVALMSFGGICLYMVKPNQLAIFAAYFSLWWSGVELAREYGTTGRTSLRGQRFSFALIALCTLSLSVIMLARYSAGESVRFGYPEHQLRHFTAGLFVLLLGVFMLRKERSIHISMRFFFWVAPVSYGLYISHQPILTLLNGVGFPRPVVLTLAVPCCFSVAFLLERVAHPWMVLVIRQFIGKNTIPAQRL